MGLFDFVSDIGKKVFSKEEDASKAVTQHIAEDNPGVENLSVTVENGVANIQGVAANAAALEKAVLMAGNIQGIHSVTSDASINGGETLGSDETFYVIQKGDTLWKIAEKAYGNGAKYTAIVEANKEVNHLSITEGRLPQKSGECFLDSAFASGQKYLRSIRENMRSSLDQMKIQNPDGTITNVKDRRKDWLNKIKE